MRLLSTVAAALCLAASMASGKSTEGMAPRIVGGVEVSPPFKYPWMVTLFAQVDEKTNFPFCGGSLIDPSYILTASHCSVVFDPSILSVAVHRHDLSQTSAAESGIVRTITKVIIHPGYQPDTVSNDYAVWKLSSPITNVDPVTLDTTDIAVTGSDALVMGWGTTQYEGDASAVLLETTLKITDFTACNTFWRGSLNPSTQVCAGVDAGGKDTCQGDSGGPMLISSGGNLVQVGVVSFGNKCAEPNSPGVYSKVAGATSFISAAKDDTKTDGCDKNPCKSGKTCIASIDTYACITAEGGSGTSPAHTLFPSLFVALLALIFSLFHF